MSGFSTPLVTNLFRITGVTANNTISLPAGYVVERVYIKNNTANVVTGGVKVGTTSGGVDVVLALAVGASVTVDTPALISAISASDQTLFVQAVTAWNSANVDVVVKVPEVF